jgi:hypothetical protein
MERTTEELANKIKYSLDRRRGLHPEDITEEALKQAGCMEVVCAMPKDFMERVSYLGDLLSQMTMDSNGIKDDRLRLVAGKLCQAVSYMLNSCSWRDGELHDFDYEELRRKLSVFRSSRE